MPRLAWTPYLALEWLEGTSLDDDMVAREARAEPPRSLAGIIELLDHAAEALGVAHAQGVAHRDIKPANLFLAEVGGRRIVKVVDFGIAKVMSDAATTSGALVVEFPGLPSGSASMAASRAVDTSSASASASPSPSAPAAASAHARRPVPPGGMVRASHILVAYAGASPSDPTRSREEARARAEAALVRVHQGEDFVQLAAEYGDDATRSRGGDLGAFSREKLPAAFTAAAFALEPGATSASSRRVMASTSFDVRSRRRPRSLFGACSIPGTPVADDAVMLVARFTHVAAVSIAALVSTRDAAAQDAEPAPAEPSPMAAPRAPAEERAERGRLRIGLNLNGGVGTHDELTGPTFGATFRIGYQANRLVGFYGNLSSVTWAGASSRFRDVTVIWGSQVTPMVSLTPVDALELAVGPSLDYFSGGDIESGGGITTAAIVSTVGPGAHGRVALHLGSRNEETGRRRGFTIGADVHPTFIENGPATFFTLGLGYDWM